MITRTTNATFMTGRQPRGQTRRIPAALALLAALAQAAPAIAAEAPVSKVILPERKPPVPAPKAAAGAPAPTVQVNIPELPALTAREKEILTQAIKSASKRDWSKARATAALARNPLINKIIEWAYIREPGPHVGFAERTAFIVANPKWPNANDIRRRAEDAISPSDSLSAVAAWFDANPPLSTAGKAAYARALLAQGKTEQAHALARNAWTTGSLNKEDERTFLAEFRSIMTPDDHWMRIDLILYDEQTSAAERLIPYVDEGRAAVARARIALITDKGNSDALVNQVPQALQNDSGLLYNRVKWRREHDNDLGARELVPPFAVSGPRPDLWWRERNALARDALAEGNITEAYALAKHHGSLDAVSVSEAEWLAGWIALRFLKDGKTALAHFEKVYDSVQTPPSLSRGAYWTGRTIESLNRPDLAAEWYQRAAAFVTTYYGQLALARLQGNTIPQLPQDPSPTPEERAAFNANEVTRALRALMDVDAKVYQRSFAQALTDNAASASDRQMTAELLSRFARTDLGVVIARNAAREKITLVKYGYPAPAYTYPERPEKALVLAITRQESNFDVAAQSSVGARGLMQLMPPTARALSKATKQAYAEKRLTTDAAYNMRLGSAYLSTLLDTFDGSYILTAAAYNAGPNRPKQWVRQFGDPRDPSVDAIDWVEQIPFGETRNYVQRVMENVMIYRAVLNGTPKIQKTLEAELARHQ
jgi:soluble lytic murein transglycosylase